MSFNTKNNKGFTLIELLIVVAIIAILAAIILATLGAAKDKGSDAAVKSNLANGLKQAEVFYNTNTAVPNSYTNVCATGPIGGQKTIEPFLTAAATAESKTYNATAGTGNRNPATGGANGTVTCNDSGTAWAAEVPLKTTTPAANQFWCVDSTGKSAQETGFSLGAADYTCN